MARPASVINISSTHSLNCTSSNIKEGGEDHNQTIAEGTNKTATIAEGTIDTIQTTKDDSFYLDGWSRIWSEENQAYYFFNEATNESSWNDPRSQV